MRGSLVSRAVEDNPINQKVAVRQLETLSLRADVVGSGKEALEMLQLAQVPTWC